MSTEATIEEPTQAAKTQTPEGDAFSDGVKRMQDKFSTLMKEMETTPAKPPTEVEKKETTNPEEKEKPTEQPKTEVKSEDGALKDEPPANLSPKAVESWKSFKTKANTEIASRDKTIGELKLKLSEFEKKLAQPVVDTKALESLKSENAALDAELKKLAIERHPKFKAHFDKRIEAAIETAKKLVSKENADKVAKLLSLPENEYRTEQLEAMVADLSPLRQNEFAVSLSKLRDLHTEREAEIARASESYQQLQQSETQQTEQQKAKHAESVAKVTAQALAFSKNLAAFKPKEGDEEHNKQVADRESLVKAFFAGQIRDDMLSWIPGMAAQAFYLQEREIPSLKAEIKKRDEIIKSYTDANPKQKPGGDGSGGGNAEPQAGDFIKKAMDWQRK